MLVTCLASCEPVAAAREGERGHRAQIISELEAWQHRAPPGASLRTEEVCPLVMPPEPGRVTGAQVDSGGVPLYGTDLGRSYRDHSGALRILFGDTWPGISQNPLHPHACINTPSDDTEAVLELPEPWDGRSCPRLRFETEGDALSYTTLHRWDGARVRLGALSVPIAAFDDGQREWALFYATGGQSCVLGACPDHLDPRAGELSCAPIADPIPRHACVDDSGIQGRNSAIWDARLAVYLHVAARDPRRKTAFTSHHAFLTNKFQVAAARTVARFEPEHPELADYRSGHGDLLVWGRPGFDARGGGRAGLHLLHHELPLRVGDDGRLRWRPRFFRGFDARGRPLFSERQRDAVPLPERPIDPAGHTSMGYVAELERWVMLTGGAMPGALNAEGDDASAPQPAPGAIHLRLSEHPWGPFSDAQPVLTRRQAARHLVCDARGEPEGCRPPPAVPIRHLCVELYDRGGPGRLYGPNIIEQLTRAAEGGGRSADIYWNVSTWHPYGVLLERTRVTLP